MLFDRGVGSQNITSFEGLRDLIIMEDFRNCLPKNVSTYLGEHKDSIIIIIHFIDSALFIRRSQRAIG